MLTLHKLFRYKSYNADDSPKCQTIGLRMTFRVDFRKER